MRMSVCDQRGFRVGFGAIALALAGVIGGNAAENGQSLEEAFKSLKTGNASGGEAALIAREFVPKRDAAYSMIVSKLKAPACRIVDGRLTANDDIESACKVLVQLGTGAFSNLVSDLSTADPYLRANLLIAIANFEQDECLAIMMSHIDDTDWSCPTDTGHAMRIYEIAWSAILARLDATGHRDPAPGFLSANETEQARLRKEIRNWWQREGAELVREVRSRKGLDPKGAQGPR